MAFSFKDSKFKTFLAFFIVWLLASGIGIYFRLYPLLNHASNEATEKATVLILSNLRKTITASVEKQYPRISPAEKNQRIQNNLNALLHIEGSKARQTIHRLAQEMDASQIESKKPPHLLASDSYNYFDLTENIQQTGTISETIRGSKFLNPKMLAPLGHWEPLTVHPFVGYYIHKIISSIKPNAPLVYTVSFTPLVIVVLTLIPFLIICYLFRCSAWSALVGSVYFVLAPIFIKRSTFGWYDNDPYNILFPLLILASVFYGLTKKTKIKPLTIWACISAFLIPLYALFWHGWIFFEINILLAGVLIILFNHFAAKKKKHTRNLIIYFFIIPAGAFLGISILFGIKEFLILFQEGWTALLDFLSPGLSPWPDLYLGVGELRKTSLPFIIDINGGYFFFMVALLGLLLYLLKAVREPNKSTASLSIIITVLLVSTILITFGAERFSLLCLIPLSILFTLGIREIFCFIENNLSKLPLKEKHQAIFTNTILLCISAALIIAPLKNTNGKMPTLLNQIFNDTWETTLVKIKNETPPESIINTWWSPGHFIKAIAKRKVTFDGATINVPQAYWLANVFLSQDENSSLGLLRMLNNSANTATEYLQSLGFKLSECVDILKTITPLSKESARKKLQRFLRKDDADKLLMLTHKKPPPSYILIYNEFVEKSIQLSFIGNWDFQKIEQINANAKLRQSVPAPSSKEYVSFLWKLAGGQPRYSKVFTPIAATDKQLIFAHNIRIDLEQMRCTINSKEFGEGIPESIVYLKDDQLVEKTFSDASLTYSVILFKKANIYSCLLLEKSLAQSLFVRLYFFNGKGLKHIEPFIDEENLTRRTHIMVYKVDWENFLKDL